MLAIRQARLTDVTDIRNLLADDQLGKTREDLSEAGLNRYIAAFTRIDQDPNNTLYVAIRDDRLIATYQLTIIPYLSRGGNLRALVEAVRVAKDLRGQGIGSELMRHAMTVARDKGCKLMQLTSDKTRNDAHQFYVKLGFSATHEGFKCLL